MPMERHMTRRQPTSAGFRTDAMRARHIRQAIWFQNPVGHPETTAGSSSSRGPLPALHGNHAVALSFVDRRRETNGAQLSLKRPCVDGLSPATCSPLERHSCNSPLFYLTRP